MLALLFPGQGSQEVGMGRDVAEASPAARDVFESADRALGMPLSKLCFEGPEEDLVRTEVQQPAILATSVALLRALEAERAPRPAFLAGHSLGEYTALVAAGALHFEDAVRLVHARGRFMQEAVPEGRGAMAAVLAAPDGAVERCCADAAARSGGTVSPANYNSAQQTVIAGDALSVETACSLLRDAGARRTIPLPVSAPFHCELMRPAAEKLAVELARVRFADPTAPVVHNVDARPNAEGARIPELLERQVCAPVRFREVVEQLEASGVTHVLEIGPGRVLCGLVARTRPSLERASLSRAEDLSRAADFVEGAALPHVEIAEIREPEGRR